MQFVMATEFVNAFPNIPVTHTKVVDPSALSVLNVQEIRHALEINVRIRVSAHVARMLSVTSSITFQHALAQQT